MRKSSEYKKKKMRSFFPEDPVIPSRVTGRMYIEYHPQTPDLEIDSSEDDSSSNGGEDILPVTSIPRKVESDEHAFTGKWMLFYEASRIDIARGMTAHDYAWQFVFPLVDNFENTRVTSALCTTGWQGFYPKMTNSTNGVIVCFTEDYRDLHDVKKAADSIRQVFHYPHNILYKTDEATLSGIYMCYGHKYICIYKHTPDCKMYVRDKIDPLVWRVVEFEE